MDVEDRFFRPVVRPADRRGVRPPTRLHSLINDLPKRPRRAAEQGLASVALEEPPLGRALAAYHHERTGPIVVEVRHVKSAVTLGELQAQQGVGVVPSDDYPTVSTSFLANLPEKLAKAAQVVVGGKRPLGAVGRFNMDKGNARHAAHAHVAGEKAARAFDSLVRVRVDAAQDFLVDEQFVFARRPAVEFAPSSGNPQDGPVQRPVRQRLAAVVLDLCILFLRRRPGRLTRSSEAVEELRQSPLGH